MEFMPAPFLIREVEPSDARGIAAVHACAWQTTYRGIIPDSVLDVMSEEAGAPRFLKTIEKHRLENSPYPFLVATMGDRIVGFSDAVKPIDPPPGFDCEIKAIYIDPNRQRMGIGRALIAESARLLIGTNHKALIIWAAAENPWRRFYEKIGGELLPETKHPEIGGKPIAHVAYGWRDLGGLAAIP